MQEFLDLAQNGTQVTEWLKSYYDRPITQLTNWRFHLSHQISSRKDFERFGITYTDDEWEGLAAQFHAGVSPYYMALTRLASPSQDPIGRQVIPQAIERVNVEGLDDPLDEVPHSPVKEVIHLYPDRVAFCVAQLCPVYCRYCFRKRRDEENGLHFNRKIVDRGIQYIAETKSIRDVLITGGDPFMANDETLVDLVARLRQIKHVEIIRFGTRTPVALPYRVTQELVKKLQPYHPIYVNTHFNHPSEITEEATMAIENLVNHGFPVGNQSVLLRGINDDADTMLALCQGLLRIRVKPYYLFHPHRVVGTDHLRVPVSKGLDIMRKLRGNITGFGIPTYMMDTVSGKIPLTPDYSLGRDGNDMIFQDIRGDIVREKYAFGEPSN